MTYGQGTCVAQPRGTYPILTRTAGGVVPHRQEPHLLHGVPISRMQQLREATRDHAHSLEHIAATPEAFQQSRLRMWFQNVLGDYY